MCVCIVLDQGLILHSHSLHSQCYLAVLSDVNKHARHRFSCELFMYFCCLYNGSAGEC